MTNIDRITVTIDVDTTKVKVRAVEDALIEILSQWEADEKIVSCDLCIDEVKNDPEDEPGPFPFRLTSTYTLSIEPIEGKTYQHGFHLGTSLTIARDIAEARWHSSEEIRTVALKLEGKLVHYFDGDRWSSAVTPS